MASFDVFRIAPSEDWITRGISARNADEAAAKFAKEHSRYATPGTYVITGPQSLGGGAGVYTIKPPAGLVIEKVDF